MAVSADILFTQGPNTDVAGRAVIGTLTDGDIIVTNGNNTNVESWEQELLYVPPGSGLSLGIFASGVSPTPSGNAGTPDVPGCYRVRSIVRDASGLSDTDIRNFGVKNFRGHIIPPYQKNPDPIDLSLKADELNFNGQLFGWAGDRVEGLFEKYFETYEDKFPVTVTTTPFTAVINTANIWLVDTTTIGSASIFNLPSNARDGQVFFIKDNQNDAFAFPITVTVPGGDRFEDATTTRVIFANGGLIAVMKLTGVSWRVLENTNKEEFIDIFSGQDSTSNSGFTRVASLPFNPNNYPLSTRFVFEAIMETTVATNPHEVQLFNVTLSSAVSTPLSSVSLIPELQTDTLVKPADLAVGNNVYELQHRMSAGVGPDVVTLSSAHLRIVYALTG